jgi:hypothetical protein
MRRRFSAIWRRTTSREEAEMTRARLRVPMFKATKAERRRVERAFEARERAQMKRMGKQIAVAFNDKDTQKALDELRRDNFAAYAIACTAWGDPLVKSSSIVTKRKFNRKQYLRQVARNAYDLADAMLKERRKRV